MSLSCSCCVPCSGGSASSLLPVDLPLVLALLLVVPPPVPAPSCTGHIQERGPSLPFNDALGPHAQSSSYGTVTTPGKSLGVPYLCPALCPGAACVASSATW